jgi:hypothetical protein
VPVVRLARADGTGAERPPATPLELARALPGRVARRLLREWSQLPTRREQVRAQVFRLLHRGAPPRRQLVVCGFPRSGTSLLYNMLAVALPQFAHDAFEASALRSLWRFEDHLSKLPLDVLRLDAICRRNLHGKRLQVLVPIRDPRDLVTSIHPNVPGDYFIGWESSYRVGLGDAAEPRPDLPGIREIEAALRAHSGRRDLELVRVRFEELVRTPDRVQEQLAARLGLEFRARFSGFHRDAERIPYRYDAAHLRPGSDASLVREHAAPDPSRAGKWRDPVHRARIREQFGAHPELLALVRAWGYEEDDSWFEAWRR